MRNNLMPTVISDKNGKVTTVHRRTDATAPKVSALAGIKPTLPQKTTPSAKSVDNKVVKVKWKITQGSLPMSDKSFLTRAGLANSVLTAEIKTNGHEMTRGEVFEFMKLGLTFSEAAALHQIGGPLDEWMDNESFNDALPGDQARVFMKDGERTIALDETMELLKREGVSLNKAAKLVRNGLSDEMLQRSVLTPNEIFTLFNRFSYQPSINPDVTTNSAATMDALNEGLLPFDLVENMDADKSTMTTVVYALYPPVKKIASPASLPSGARSPLVKKVSLAYTLSSDAISEPVRQELIADHEKISQVVLVMSKFSNLYADRLKSIDDTLSAIKKFGFDACLKNHPNILNYTLSNGESVGEKRLDEAKDSARAVADMFESDAKSPKVYPTATGIKIHKDGAWMSLSYTDIAEFNLMGWSEEAIFEKTVGADMDSNRALAIAQKRVSPAVSSGWL